MADETPTTPPVAPSEPAPPLPPTKFEIGEEFGTAKKNLPPVRIVAIGVGIIVVVWAIAAFLERPKPGGAGAIDQIASVEIPDQGAVMVAINVSFQNNGEKPLWIHTIQAELQTASGSFTDDAASPADFDRYYQAFPVLKEHAIEPLQREARINPGGISKGTIIVAFPVTPEAFAGRKLLKVMIQPYDQPVPVVLSK